MTNYLGQSVLKQIAESVGIDWSEYEREREEARRERMAVNTACDAAYSQKEQDFKGQAAVFRQGDDFEVIPHAELTSIPEGWGTLISRYFLGDFATNEDGMYAWTTLTEEEVSRAVDAALDRATEIAARNTSNSRWDLRDVSAAVSWYLSGGGSKDSAAQIIATHKYELSELDL